MSKKDSEDKNKIVDDLDISSDLLTNDSQNEKKENEILENKEKNDQEQNNSEVIISKSKIALIKKLLENIKENNEKLIHLLSGFISDDDEEHISIGQMSDNDISQEEDAAGGRIIEGVFDGENMIGPDGKQYSVPANYASKSKLVEGDILKLTITASGTFVYKQIGPIERSRIIGQLKQESNGNFIVKADGKKLRVLTASVTYFKGHDGDEIVVLVPKTGESKWAAVENIVKKNG